MNRIAIYPSDIQTLTGKGRSYSYKLLRQIRQYFGKEKHQYVSIEEYSIYMGHDPDDTEARLNGHR